MTLKNFLDSLRRAAPRTAPLKRVLLSLALVWMLLSVLPSVPLTLYTGMDASWYYAINMAHAKGVPFGTHLMFTVGPLGYLATPDPDYAHAGTVLVFRVFTYLCLLYGILRCLHWLGLRSAVVIGGVLVIQTLLAQHFPDVWSAAYLAICLAAAASGAKSLCDLTLAGFAAGFTLLFKVNEGFMAYAVFGSIWLYAAFRLRTRIRLLIVIALLPALVLLAGMQLLSGNALAAIPYIRNALDTMGGFSSAASFPGPVWQSGLAFLYLLLIFSIPVLLRAYSTLTLPGVLPALLVAFTAFKHGMVRQDSHADMVQVKLAIAALFLMVACTRSAERRVLGALALFSALFTVGIVTDHQEWIITQAKARITPPGIVASLRYMISTDFAWQQVRRDMHDHLAPLKLDTSFHQIVGQSSVDAFPENIDVIRANGWNYLPRPGIQSSASFTPRLDAINARYLESGRGSDFALFVWYAIDVRHPFLQDPQTVFALLDRYQPAYAGNQALLLQRSQQANFTTPEKIGEASIGWYERVDLPPARPGELILARIHIRPSLWGRLHSFLFRSTPVVAHIGYRSGKSNFYRVVPANLAAGAIVSAMPHDLNEFTAFVNKEPDPDPPAWISWNCKGLLEYKAAIHMEWYRTRWTR